MNGALNGSEGSENTARESDISFVSRSVTPDEIAAVTAVLTAALAEQAADRAVRTAPRAECVGSQSAPAPHTPEPRPRRMAGLHRLTGRGVGASSVPHSSPIADPPLAGQADFADNDRGEK